MVRGKVNGITVSANFDSGSFMNIGILGLLHTEYSEDNKMYFTALEVMISKAIDDCNNAFSREIEEKKEE